MNKLLVTAAMLGLSGCAFAAAPAPMSVSNLGWYIGAGLNYHGVTAARYNLIEPLGQIKMDNAQIGINLFVGNRLSTHFGTEAGIAYLGDVKWLTKKRAGSTLDQSLTIKSKNNYNLYYDAYFFMPLNPGAVHSFDVFARAGVGFMHTKDSVNVSQPEPQAANSDVVLYNSSNSLSTFALNWGAGLSYNYRQFSVRAYYSHFAPSTDADDWFFIPDSINLDGIFHFG